MQKRLTQRQSAEYSEEKGIKEKPTAHAPKARAKRYNTNGI